MADLVHGDNYFHFGDKVTHKYRVGMSDGGWEYEYFVVIGWGERPFANELCRCANKEGAVILIHPRLLDKGWRYYNPDGSEDETRRAN